MLNAVSLLIHLVTLTSTFTVTSGCNPYACPALPCSEPVKLRSKCCPICPCKYDGTYYTVGDLVFTSNRCVTCECTRYGIECLPWPCPKPDCPKPIKRPGGCCPECGCKYQGRFYQMGYQVIKKAEPCKDCRCGFDGRVTCTIIGCPPLDCDNPISVPGTCCKQCGCRARDGRIFDYGPLPDNDRCKPCTCKYNGTVTCEQPNCPDVQCSQRFQYTVDGECCPRCACYYQNVYHEQGDIMPLPPRDKCALNCSCGKDGEPVCTYPTCPALDCPNPILMSGDCCPSCGCLDKKKNLREFGPITDDPCTPCTCNRDGNITCGKRQACLPLKCVSGFYRPSAAEEKVCCPKCKCRYKGKIYKPGEIFEDKSCKVCECQQYSGRVSCEGPDCSASKVQCGNPTVRRGECCPTCADGPTCIYKEKTKDGSKENVIEYGKYKVFGNNVCTCAGNPWFPNAFCAPKSLPITLKKVYDKRWMNYGYVLDKGRNNKKRG